MQPARSLPASTTTRTCSFGRLARGRHTDHPGDPRRAGRLIRSSAHDLHLNDEADFSGEQLSDTTSSSAPNSINLFQPSATLDVTANPTTATQLGQVITYTYTVTNTSSADSPDLALGTANDSFTDTLLGDVEADAIAAGAGDMAPGASVTFTETRAIQAGDPTPLVDSAAVAFTLAQNLGEFSNIIHASDSASVTLLPHLNIVKAVTAATTFTRATPRRSRLQ